MRSWRAVVLGSALAVFALAVGIILGSGPLRTALTGQTANEADRLRGDIADRDAVIFTQAKDIEILERYLDELTPVAADARLAGQSVILVLAPDAVPEGVVAIREAIADAGGVISTTATLGDNWLAAAQGAFRSALAQEIVEDVGVGEADTSPEAVLHGALVQSLVPSLAAAAAQPAEGEELDPSLPPVDPAVAEQRAAVLEDVLTRAELVAIEREPVDPEEPAVEPTVVIIVPGPGDPDPAQAAAESASLTRLALAFTEGELATVVATGPVTESDVSHAVQAAPVEFGAVSVVADAWGAAGPLLVVLAAQEQLLGGSGVYGDPSQDQLVPVP